MIIFDLDGTLACCEHRRHFVDRNHPENLKKIYSSISLEWTPKPELEPLWKPDWRAFYEACDKDTPIEPTIEMFERFGKSANYGTCDDGIDYEGIEIWSGRSESVRDKTKRWLDKHVDSWSYHSCVLKMRPIGDNTPDDVLKEKWLDEALAQGKKIEMVFDDRPKVIRMWRRRGIFVFNCCQHDKEF